MNINTLIAVIALVLVVYFAVRYIWKEKKRGAKCIGCSAGSNCQGNAGCCTSGTVPKKVRKMTFGE